MTGTVWQFGTVVYYSQQFSTTSHSTADQLRLCLLHADGSESLPNLVVNFKPENTP